MKPPSISVVMPVYNGEKYLSEAIESVLNQTFKDFEFIIIDDGSEDKSSEIIDNYTKKDNRIIYIRNKENRGVTYSLNRGISIARGEYIARMDCDDISFPKRFEIQLNYMQSHNDIGILGSQAEIIDEHGLTTGVTDYPIKDPVIKWAMCYYCAFIHPTIMMRKELLKKSGGYQPSFPHAEDYDLWARASKLTKFENLGFPLLFLRKHAGNISQKFQSVQIKSGIEISKKFISSQIGLKPPTIFPIEMLTLPRELSTNELSSICKFVNQLLKINLKHNELRGEERKYIKMNSSRFQFIFAGYSKKFFTRLKYFIYILFSNPHFYFALTRKKLRNLTDKS